MKFITEIMALVAHLKTEDEIVDDLNKSLQLYMINRTDKSKSDLVLM